MLNIENSNQTRCFKLKKDKHFHIYLLNQKLQLKIN
jgi:hypothetical protein